MQGESKGYENDKRGKRIKEKKNKNTRKLHTRKYTQKQTHTLIYKHTHTHTHALTHTNKTHMWTHALAYTLRHTSKHTLNALERGVCLFVCMCLGEGPVAFSYFTETCLHLRPSYIRFVARRCTHAL